MSQELSLSTIIQGTPSPDYKNYKLEFGTYILVTLLVTDKMTNTPRARAFGAIALHPTGGNDSSYHFMSLSTGEVINRAPAGYWTVVPISDMVIGRVETLAKHQSQPLLQNSNLVMENSPDQEINDNEFDVDFVPDNNNNDNDNNDSDDYNQNYTPIDHGELDGDSVKSEELNVIRHLTGTNGDELTGTNEDGQYTATSTQEDTNGTVEDPDNTIEDVEPQPNVAEPHLEEEAETPREANQESEANDTIEEDETTSSQANSDSNQPNTDQGNWVGYNLCGGRTCSYAYRFANAIDTPASQKQPEELLRGNRRSVLCQRNCPET